MSVLSTFFFSLYGVSQTGLLDERNSPRQRKLQKISSQYATLADG